ncbi:MAG TPA: hypothetical protein VFZ77_10965 [Acidimicrobiales bacterium]
MLRDAGLSDVEAEGNVRPVRPADLAAVLRPALERIAPAVQAAGVAADDLDEVVRMLDGTGSGGAVASTYTPILVSAAGRLTSRRGVATSPSRDRRTAPGRSTGGTGGG